MSQRFLSIRDLQKISSETIGSLGGPTPVKAGDRTIGVLIPLKRADPEKLEAVLKDVERLAKKRDPARDQAVLEEMGAYDPTHWSIEAVRKLKNKKRRTRA